MRNVIEISIVIALNLQIVFHNVTFLTISVQPNHEQTGEVFLSCSVFFNLCVQHSVIFTEIFFSLSWLDLFLMFLSEASRNRIIFMVSFSSSSLLVYRNTNYF